MTRQRFDISNDKGFALIYMCVFLVVLLLFVGLAVDTGRAYVVKAQLTKAVDGAALGAARMLNSGNPRTEAENIFNANFPLGFMGTTSVTPTSSAGFYRLTTDVTTGINTVTITASAVMPTSFMSLANFNNVTVSSEGQATRRMVDLSLVIDVSSSIGWRWPYVRDAVISFINAFDQTSDRVSLTFFGNGARVIDRMRDTRGFDKAAIISHVPAGLPGGSTAMVQGLYRGWDELRAVPNGLQSGLRVIVLFTDGCSNSVPGLHDVSGTSKGLRTWDFPKTPPDPDSQTHDQPHLDGLYDTETGNTNPWYTLTANWNAGCPTAPCPPGVVLPAVPYMPLNAFMTQHRSIGIPTSFPLQTSALNVDGAPQNMRRGLRNFHPGPGKYPAEIFNVNNAARNLVEIIGDAARSDAGGDYPIRIYSIGMGELVQYGLGTRREKSEDILKRVANDITSPDFNSGQLEGKFYFARTEQDVSAAFAALQNQIIRLSK
jgi:Flp pilus assembly protein TadG